jgi:hypothetical protein
MSTEAAAVWAAVALDAAFVAEADADDAELDADDALDAAFVSLVFAFAADVDAADAEDAAAVSDALAFVSLVDAPEAAVVAVPADVDAEDAEDAAFVSLVFAAVSDDFAFVSEVFAAVADADAFDALVAAAVSDAFAAVADAAASVTDVPICVTEAAALSADAAAAVALDAAFVALPGDFIHKLLIKAFRRFLRVVSVDVYALKDCSGIRPCRRLHKSCRVCSVDSDPQLSPIDRQRLPRNYDGCPCHALLNRRGSEGLAFLPGLEHDHLRQGIPGAVQDESRRVDGRGMRDKPVRCRDRCALVCNCNNHLCLRSRQDHACICISCGINLVTIYSVDTDVEMYVMLFKGSLRDLDGASGHRLDD